jgi:hypothetical protein
LDASSAELKVASWVSRTADERALKWAAWKVVGSAKPKVALSAFRLAVWMAGSTAGVKAADWVSRRAGRKAATEPMTVARLVALTEMRTAASTAIQSVDYSVAWTARWSAVSKDGSSAALSAAWWAWMTAA